MKALFSKLLLDVICLFLFAIPLFVFKFFDVPLTRRGYFCNDNGLRYPYHSSTISSTLNIIIAFSAMFFLNILFETLIYFKVEKKAQTEIIQNPIIVEVYRAFGYFMVGAAINQILTDTCKLAVGRLRPHFFEVCMPSILCTAENQNEYVFNFTCTRTQHPLISTEVFKKKLRETGKSFPSGHASLAIYASIFIGIYLEYRARRLNFRLTRHLLQVAVLVWGVWVCCSRVFDNKHHPSDVMFGAALGSLVAAFTGFLYISSHQSSHCCPLVVDSDLASRKVASLGKSDEGRDEKEAPDSRLLKAE